MLRPVPPLKRLVCLVYVLATVACSNDAETPAVATLNQAALPGVYAGVFPCDGCAGIEVSLWLRSDARFFFRQHYPADQTREASNAYSFGRWHAVVDGDAIELVGEGPRRTFESAGTESLLMRTHSTLEHRLTRQPATTDFTDIIRVTGVMQLQGDGASFSECLTGYVVPVSKRGEFARFQHQYRSVIAKGKPAFVEFDGRYAWSAEGAPQSLTIEKFVTIRADGSC